MNSGSRPTRTLVVELCGLPGAGKTTFAQRLVHEVGSRGLAAHVAADDTSAGTRPLSRYLTKARLAAAVVASAPGWQLRSAATYALAQRAGRDRLAVPLNWWVAQGRVSVSRGVPGLAVVDEGPVQAAWTAAVLASSETRAAVVTELRGASPADVLVVLETSPEVAAHRLATRTSRHSRLQHVTPSELAALMRSGERLLQDLVRIRSDGGAEVLVVPAGGFEGALQALAGRADGRRRC